MKCYTTLTCYKLVTFSIVSKILFIIMYYLMFNSYQDPCCIDTRWKVGVHHSNFVNLFEQLWRKPYQCKCIHLLEKQYKCIYLQEIPHHWMMPSSREKPYQSRYYEGQIINNKIVLQQINSHIGDYFIDKACLTVLLQRGCTSEKRNQCNLLICGIIFACNRIKKYTPIHTVNSLNSAYSLYRIGRSMFIKCQNEYVRLSI